MEIQKNNQIKTKNSFLWTFYYIAPASIPILVYFGTLAFNSFIQPQFLWIPLILIYWGIIWTYTALFQRKQGNVFTKERFHKTLKLQGPKLKWQYLLVYGPLLYNIPLFIILYAKHMSALMYLVVAIASLINGFSEEIFWRATLDEAGIQLNLPESKRLIYEPIIFSLWHVAFIIHLFPHDNNLLLSMIGIILMTWSSGLVWLWVMLKSNRVFPQCVVHVLANFFSIFPMILISVIQLLF